jgi:dipeptidyl aminopeptidase/acylaminoacyl peptidase
VYRGGCDEYGDCPKLYLIPSSGGRLHMLSRVRSGALWSPDSRLVVVDGQGLVRFEVATRRSVRIARGDVQSGWGWSFSPDGDEIAYTVARPGRCFSGSLDIYVVGVDGGMPRRLTRGGCSAFPVWGPDGIAFARLISYRGWGRHEIWRMDPDGANRRTITGRVPQRLLGNGITGLVPVALSDDGKRLLAGLANEFGFVPFAVDPKRGTVRKVDGYGYADRPGGLSHDGQSVLVNVGDVGSYDGTRVEIAPYAGGPSRVIARRAGEASWNL